MFQDLRYASRGLLRAPGFTLVAVLTLALGIGATSAMFTVVNRVVLDPLPFARADRLVLVWGSKPQEGQLELPFSQPDFEDLRAESQSFHGLAAWALGRGNVTGQTDAEQVQFAVVTGNFLEVLGVRPALGRTLTAAEERPGTPPVALISHALWQRRFAASPDALGATLTLDGRAVQIVGVLPAAFSFLTFPAATDVWMPLGADPFDGRRFARGARSMGVLGRLKDGVTLGQARAEAAGVAAGLAARHPRFNTGRLFTLVPLRDQVVRGVKDAALVLLAAVSLVLLIACANVASLQLARATGRQRELTIRAALGASRRRLIRHQLAESAVLAAAGGGAGILLASWLVDLLVTIPYRTDTLFIPYAVPKSAIGVDGFVLVFTAALTFATAFVFGLVPAWTASRPRVTDALRAGGRATPGGRQQGARAALVVTEVALALVLLVTAGLTVRSFLRLQQVDPGFSPSGVLSLQMTLSRGRYAEPAAIAGFYSEALDGLRALPGVVGAGAVEYLPLSGLDGSSGFYVDGRPAPARADEQQTHYRSVAGDYFSVMGIELAAGRRFSDRDAAGAARVAIVNETMARQYWPGENALGRRVALDFETMKFHRDRAPDIDIPSGMREIVGIVRDIRHGSLRSTPVPELYMPYQQRPTGDMTLVLRSSGDPLALAAPAREVIRRIDPNQPIAHVETLSDLLAASLAPPRTNFVLLSVFAAVALVLAMVGVYGLLSHAVVQRTPELGIRLALGGQPNDIRLLILRQGLRLVLAGVLVGVPAALALGHALRTLLFGVAPTDAVTLLGASATLVAVAAIACYVPARRATRVDPMTALRSE
jgi:putative ABC transport system permease protein